MNAKFPGIEDENPLKIAEGGVQAPFCQKDLVDALKTGNVKATYTCGINFAWVNATYSATPGIPVRMPAVEALRDNVFREPKPLEHFHVAVPGKDYVVEEHRGGVTGFW